MKKNRSSALLFCIVVYDSVMCLDIIEHPSSDKFFCFNLMKIVKNNNWMGKIGFICNDDPNYVQGSLKPIIEKDEDLTELYIECKVNSAFEFDGKMYCSIDGITGTGDSLHNVITYQQFIKELESKIEKNGILEEISDIIFEDNVMKFTVIIKRRNNKIRYQCYI